MEPAICYGPIGLDYVEVKLGGERGLVQMLGAECLFQLLQTLLGKM